MTKRERHVKFHKLMAMFFATHAILAVVAFIWFPPVFEFMALFYVVVNACYTTAATHWGAAEAAEAQSEEDEHGST